LAERGEKDPDVGGDQALADSTLAACDGDHARDHRRAHNRALATRSSTGGHRTARAAIYMNVLRPPGGERRRGDHASAGSAGERLYGGGDVGVLVGIDRPGV